MGYSDNETLGTNFMNNYTHNTRTLVRHSNNITVAEGTEEWLYQELDTPFWYDGKQSLILEVAWDGGSGSVHNYFSNTATNPTRLKSADPDSPTGFLSNARCQFVLSGTQELESDTAAAIKIHFNNE